jgi:hypothetical protein
MVLQRCESEFAYERQWKRTGLIATGEEPTDYPVEVLLLPEPDNYHDKNAVQLLVDGTVLAYLPRDTAKANIKQINKHINKHGSATTQGIARLWKQDGETQYRLGIYLPVKW